VHIERPSADDAARERINDASNQTGLPTSAPDAPRPALPAQGRAAPDYSRRPPSGGIDRAGVGYGRPPTGGFRVR
jgi:hypothetical protein